MGLTERAVKSRLHRARLFVRHELNGQRAAVPPRIDLASGT
jgi:DNA-directed RNA polymerase specialized sigma24 family protein